MVMEEEEDLGLSLSLSFSHTKTAAAAAKVPENRLKIHHTNPSSLILPLSFTSNSPAREKTLPFSDGGRAASPVKAGIDVNCAPGARTAEDGGACSPNSTISSSSGKRSSEAEADGDRAWSRGTSDEDEDGGAGNSDSRNNSCKKLRLSKDQAAVLEETFKDQNTLNPKQKMGLAKRLGLRPRQVEVWFQNRRARTKLKQTEVDCEYLKRCYETLTKENRRLHKEVQQLRALKLSPQLYMHMPPTTLTMCPSCEQRKIAPIAARPWGPTPVLQSRAFEGLRSGS